VKKLIDANISEQLLKLYILFWGRGEVNEL